MDTDNIQQKIEMMKAVVDPWYQAIADPVKAQEIVLERLLKGYRQTEYGKTHKSEKVGSYADFQKAFPVSTFAEFKPFIDQVMAGNTHALLSEEPIFIGYTKGTTGKSKFFPITPSHAKNFTDSMLRMTINYGLSKQNFEWMSGYRLSLSSSANLGTIKVGDREMKYGYSAAVGGLIMDKTAELANKVTPTQEEIDELPSESTKSGWETRHEFAYQKARDKKITYIMSTPPILLGFGRYLYRKHHIYPKDLWQIKYLGLSGFPGINTSLALPLHNLYGKAADIREAYGGTEGGYGAQLDDKKAWSPFYDLIFFEVQTLTGIKQLHEMNPGEIGSLIISTPVLPRYRIGDLILAFEAPYFRCIGRENTKLHPYNFGKLTGKSALNIPKASPLHIWR